MVIADILDADVNGNIDPETSNQDEGTTLLTYLSKSPKLVKICIHNAHIIIHTYT